MVELYDKDLHFLGPADHVLRCSYTLKLNEMGSATIELPVGSTVHERITVGASFAKIWDGDTLIGFFRFSSADVSHETGGTVSYRLDGAECTLLDDLVAGHTELGGTGYPTANVLQRLLNYQTVQRWTLGRCDFYDEYQYNFEDVNLLEAVMSLGEVMISEYAFRFDTSTTPWTVNLVALTDTPTASLVYGRNAQRIRRTIDGKVVTRLYGRGYGEGDNQLTIASVNGGRAYIDAPQETMARYGIRAGIHVDTRQTDPATLKAQMAKILKAGQAPRITYDITAMDLYRETGEAWDAVAVGAQIAVLDETLGETVSCRVTEVEKPDMDGDPGGLRIVLGTGGKDAAEQLNSVLEKIGVHELYSQGATSMYAIRGSENADSSHPMVLDFYIPGNVLRINRCILKWQKSGYRVDFKMAAASAQEAATTASGGGATITTEEITGTASGILTSWPYVDADAQNIMHSTYVADGSVGSHQHGIQHLHRIPSIPFKIPPQTLQVSAHTHSLTIPGHTHQLTYGIATGGSTASSVTISVDGVNVYVSEGEMDITEYLERDTDGRVRRGMWHKVEIAPNGNARITATVFVQQFLQSRGGGDY